MKKYGRPMELLGGTGMFLLAMASDADNIRFSLLALLMAVCIVLVLVGDLFCRPLKRRTRVRPAAARSESAKILAFPPAA